MNFSADREFQMTKMTKLTKNDRNNRKWQN